MKKIFYGFLIFIALGIFYYTPYSFYLEPSYWEFRKLCKLNELPNNEEKYNKILGYFGKSLGDIDDFRHLKEDARIDIWLYIYYYDVYKVPSNFQERIEIDNLALKPRNIQMSLQNIIDMRVSPHWHNRRYVLSGHEGNMDFSLTDDKLACGNLYK